MMGTSRKRSYFARDKLDTVLVATKAKQHLKEVMSAEELEKKPKASSKGGKITEELLKEFKDAQKMAKKKDHDHITTKDIPLLMRGLGQNPDEDETRDIIKRIAMDDDAIDFPAFLDLMDERLSNFETAENIKAAFAVFDKVIARFLTIRTGTAL